MKLHHATLLLSLVCSSVSVLSFIPAPLHISSKSSSTCKSSVLCAELKPGSIGSFIDDALRVSQFVYTYGTIRRVVNEHDRLIRNEKPASDGFLGLKKKPLVQMYRPELVVTQRGAQEDDPNKYMRYPVTAAALTEFLSNNRQYLKQDDTGGDIEFQQLNQKSEDLPELYTERTVEVHSRYDGEIVDYFDQATNKHGFVYGITINRSIKRITVAFRGTVGGSDFLADANFNHNQDHFKDLGKDVKVHSGFSGYLFKRIKGEGRNRYDRIVAALRSIYNKLPESDRDGYKVVVNGHSLGGALANLFAFTLSVREGKGNCPLFHYVRAVSFAGAVVGNSGYNNIFEELERQNKLNLLRISNQGDVVPTNPSPFEYIQNGVNMHVHGNGKEMELVHGNQKSLLSQVNLKALSNHMIPAYENRIFQREFGSDHQPNKEILDQTFEEVYQLTLP